VHLINQCVAGVGEFEVWEDYLAIGPYSLEEYIKSHFHWLGRYWDIFGDRPPSVDTDNLEDFDKAYFLQLAHEIEQRYNIKVTSR
jgi:hypothetical protein